MPFVARSTRPIPHRNETSDASNEFVIFRHFIEGRRDWYGTAILWATSSEEAGNKRLHIVEKNIEKLGRKRVFIPPEDLEVFPSRISKSFSTMCNLLFPFRTLYFLKI
ncbi:hypothetical protein MAR_ORF140 [Marseillevirus marseillevirus]|uniref:Uncharacterized protein n=1 Tax=Marseillevirus marseillevirus TaxID=694581 RepID=D2XAE4_GBMV|nr:hypothetical protein MAR_ORF140 [Marseillevirus marseillevirus]ADB03921.1 hypothetical protein MAR_ORF140 [Marseillevirus marseillevirus]